MVQSSMLYNGTFQRAEKICDKYNDSRSLRRDLKLRSPIYKVEVLANNHDIYNIQCNSCIRHRLVKEI